MRVLYLLLGIACVALGAAGVVLPLLPTTPFILLAAFCFSRSSERLHRWLLANKAFGPSIADWERGGVISLGAKRLSATMMALLMSYPIFFKSPPLPMAVRMSLVGVFFGVSAFVWSRPSTFEQAAARHARREAKAQASEAP